MKTDEGLFSVRIVVADFYMHRPIPGLDPTYSDFRGQELKSLPVIRIFGSDSNGDKVCMHVHGVFPYFYIPYESSTLCNVDQIVYQIAASLDKAINISLGQTQSQNQHVFKIQLVKGIPYYGYHGKEHQFLKIFLYNPRFIKKAANLLQSGAILGRVFQPHESHVPYILQFFIDYNLYGMSFLHVPMEIVKYRQSEESDSGKIPAFLDVNQVLERNILRISTSRHEVDIAAAFILNRFELLSSQSGNTNPGIESIWEDERLRRQKMQDDQEIPPLEVACSQDRICAKPTESDIFYRAALQSKLSFENQEDNVSNLTALDSTIASDKKTKFNLSKLLMNSVYPGECSQDMNATLANASKIPDHLSNVSLFHKTIRARSKSRTSVSSESSFVDEEMVLSLSQQRQALTVNQTLEGEDFQLLEVMEQLEEDEGGIDLDSTLAPLSQSSRNFPSKKGEDINLNLTIDKGQELCSDDDEEDMNDYTISMDSVDKILMELSQAQSSRKETFPQFDGCDDSFLTPKKRRNNRTASKLKASPRSPRVGSASKYAPLDITVTQSPVSGRGIRENGILPNKATSSTLNGTSNGYVSRLTSSTNLRLKRCSVNLIDEFKVLNDYRGSQKVKASSSIDNEKSFIVCSLKPSTPVRNTLRMQPIDNKMEKETVKRIKLDVHGLKKCKVKLKRLSNYRKIIKKHCQLPGDISAGAEESVGETSAAKEPVVLEDDIEENSNEGKISDDIEEKSDEGKIFDDIEEKSDEGKIFEEALNVETIESTESSPAVPDDNEENVSLDANGFIKPKIRAVEVKNEPVNRRRSWSPGDISREYDRKHNFFPKAGPSGMKKSQRRRKRKVQQVPASSRQTRQTVKQQLSPEKNSPADAAEDLNICSFYEKSFVVDSPSLFSDSSPRTPQTKFSYESTSMGNCHIQSIVPSMNSELVVVTPLNLPPTFEQVNEQAVTYDIPDEVFTEPFYGDDADITSKREVGHTVLHIPGKSLNTCQEFESVVSNLKGINGWRKHIVKAMLDDSTKGGLQSSMSIKEYLSSRERVIISTRNCPPTKDDAKQWLKTVARNRKQINNEDSPIKVRTEKVKMILDTSNFSGEAGDNCELSQKSISLSPLTPENSSVVKKVEPISTNHKKFTPRDKLSAHKTPLSALQKFKERRQSRARLSLARKISRLYSLDSPSSGTDTESVKTSTNMKVPRNGISVKNLADDSDESEKLSERSFESEQISDLCSEQVKQVLEKTSFLRNISITENCNVSDVSFGLSGVTLDNTFGFKISLQNLQKVKADVQHNHLTVFSLEIHVNTRDQLKPDPQYDAVECLFFSISHDGPESPSKENKTLGCIMVVSEGVNPSLNGVATRIIVVKSELELFEQMLQLCHTWDPDILVGYEVEMNSWGYLMDRAHVLGMNLKALLSRVPSQKVRESNAEEERETFIDLDIELKLCGRILLDVWRLMRSEIALTSYTFENIAYHILHKRYAKHDFQDLTKWYNSSTTRWIVLEYYLERVNGTLQLLDQLDLIGRTSEMAKLIGIQFYEVLSRGSQFRVESMMLRIAKPKNFVPVSPSVQQRAHSRAPEYLPLILEPKSRFYSDPMIVLDFQSLYPSMIIAYNYCFSTCLGRVEHLGQSTPFEFGCSQLRVSISELKRLIENDQITVSPCGVVFVKKDVREGVLPRMLREILNTRLMVKQSMKLHKSNSTLQRVLHSRQLGLKLMANVTYGYTAANFSGRMSCVEVADSILSKARETLERAIKLVEANKQWRAKVVYGDTDSLFVLVPGRDRAEAFRIGQEIADCVTNDNPEPVKLKLEKVYQPCILQTKKRYVGYMYESADQEEPIYEAKGIETVRRDGCPAVAKMLEKCLRILFETCDVSKIKQYVCRQFTKLLTGNANVQDLIFAKEFRGKNNYKPGACVPALELTKKWLQTDPRNEPRRGERVPFLIVNGPPGLPLIRLVRSPHEYLADEGLKINAVYYITKAIIPPLNRCLLLIGADVNEWFADLPRKHLALPAISTVSSAKQIIYEETKKSTISQYFASANCIIDCGRQTKEVVCNICGKDSQRSTVVLLQKMAKLDRNYYLTKQICQSCCGRTENIECCSLDCPVLFVANLKNRERKQIQHFENLISANFSITN